MDPGQRARTRAGLKSAGEGKVSMEIRTLYVEHTPGTGPNGEPQCDIAGARAAAGSGECLGVERLTATRTGDLVIPEEK